ncbi:hypothetical protein L207DRAFT_581712 [Hyaloscypha variabilis F]|uniref:Uncharacterized protein n=1 Tax=Hyaloscypha variabilis (strain UAMH 11265 / GT02V1 / F) TaxID=1149755 RepID=A0A2J6RRX1_HYAVF|nr:hypothetical protein L207DRAFT_581712 [Hyaloscypha variabilis F]
MAYRARGGQRGGYMNQAPRGGRNDFRPRNHQHQFAQANQANQQPNQTNAMTLTPGSIANAPGFNQQFQSGTLAAVPSQADPSNATNQPSDPLRGGLAASTYSVPDRRPDPPFMAKMGQFALANRNADDPCSFCDKVMKDIEASKIHIRRVLTKRDLPQEYLDRMELVLTKEIIEPECENCRTVENERRQSQQIDRQTDRMFPRNQPYQHLTEHFDTYPDMKGPRVYSAARELAVCKQSVAELESKITVLDSEKIQLLSQADHAKNAIKSAEKRAGDAEAGARQLRASLTAQEKSLTEARKTPELDAYEIEKSAKTILRTEAKIHKAEDEARQLRAQLAEQKESSEAALLAATIRAENAELRIAELTADLAALGAFEPSQQLSAKAQDEINRLGRESNEHKDESKLLRQDQVSLQTKLDQQNSQILEMGKNANDMKAAFEMLHQQFIDIRAAATMKVENVESDRISMCQPEASTLKTNDAESTPSSLCPDNAGTMTIDAAVPPTPLC